MATAQDYGIEEHERNQAAKNTLLAYMKLGEKEEQLLVDYCARNIPRDRYVHPSLMRFELPNSRLPGDVSGLMRIAYSRALPDEPIFSRKETARIHRHALGQLVDIAGLPRLYLNRLNLDSKDGWRRILLAHNMNTLFQCQEFKNKLKEPAKFLHRMVGDELRAVLTQSYNRHLVSHAVLQPFLAVCREVGMMAAKATITDMRLHLQCYLPFAFEPIPGQFVALGSCWGNSDFGQGKLRISHTILRLNRNLGNFVTEESFSRMHVSSVVEDTDMVLSDEVAVKELEAIAAATKSAVQEGMRPEQVKKILNAIARADEEKIPWDKLRENLTKFLGQGEIKSVEDLLTTQIEDLPQAGIGADGKPLPSKWWAAAALSYLADKQEDPTRSMEYKQAAGTFLAAPEA